MKIGDRVRIINSVIVYHHPDHRNKPFDIKGQEGDIAAIITQWNNRPVSANLPFQVKFDKKFTAHFLESELEIVSGENS